MTTAIRSVIHDERNSNFASIGNRHPVKSTWPRDSFLSPDLSCTRNDVTGTTAQHHRPLRVCIIGAGIAGLYIARLLDQLAIPGLTYDILEASGRAGGRIRTHRFAEKHGEHDDYIDLGAMRYPDLPWMKRAFDLFRTTGVFLQPHFLENKACPNLFNGIRKCGPTPSGSDPFEFGTMSGGLAADDAVRKGVDAIMDEVCAPFKDALLKDLENGFEALLRFDRFTVRQYLQKQLSYDNDTIQWLETTGSATGLFDQSLTEGVMDWLAFSTDCAWWSIKGGSETLIHRMQSQQQRDVQFNKKVVRIARSGEGMMVSVRGESRPRRYCTVFNSVPLKALQSMDLQHCDLSMGQRNALSSLDYDSAVKVAIRFRSPWWAERCGILLGGQSKTDRVLRTCVYPTRGRVLLCSYTWAQDAQLMSTLIKSPSLLKETMLGDLAALHSPNISLAELEASYIDHVAIDWSNEPGAAGAFALFGPGQFSELYPYLTMPAAGGLLHFTGEATSIHHGWIAGSLDSAAHAVYRFLEQFGLSSVISLRDTELNFSGYGNKSCAT